LHAGVEWPGAQGGVLTGPWGKNIITNSLLIGHSDSRHVDMTSLLKNYQHSATGSRRRLNGGHVDGIAYVDRSTLIVNSIGPFKNRRLIGSRRILGSSGNSLSCGMEGPAYHRLTVNKVTFAEYNHPNTVAMTALAKEKFTPGGGGWEVRFQNIKWHKANNRVAWQHPHESVFVDVDGSFTEQLPGTSTVPYNELLDLFPNCIVDERYSHPFGHEGRVCKETRFVRISVGNIKEENAYLYKDLMIGYTPNDKTYVEEDNAQYFKQKWRQEGENYLIEMVADPSNDNTFVAQPIIKLNGYFHKAVGTLTPSVTMVFDEADGKKRTRKGTVSKDLSMITWFNDNDDRSIASRDYKTWYNCEIVPAKCVETPQPQYPFTEMKVPYNLKRRSIGSGYEFNVPINHIYEFRWNVAANENTDITSFDFDISDTTVSDKIWLRTQYQIAPDHFNINGITKNYYKPHTNQSIVPGYDTLMDSTFNYKFGSWTFNTQQSSVAFLLSGGVEGK
jgi:hypothetical protein